MITAHFDSLVRQLRNYSASLTMENIFVDKPWTIIDEDQEIQRLVFKKDRSLIMSKNGLVNHGSWDYLPEMRSIVINRINDSILCNEAYIDEGVMILRMDGTANQFFTLANENIIPDLDINKYLCNKRYEKLCIEVHRLANGKLLEVQNERLHVSAIGLPVSIDAEEVTDGEYQVENSNKYYEIADSKIFQIRNAVVYTNPDGVEIKVNEKGQSDISIGDSVFINNIIPEDQTINFSRLKRLIISDGKVEKLEYKNVLLRKYFYLVCFLYVIAVLFIFYIIILILRNQMHN